MGVRVGGWAVKLDNTATDGPLGPSVAISDKWWIDEGLIASHGN